MPGDVRPDGGAAPAGGGLVLQQQHRAALGGGEAGRVGGERQVGPVGPVGQAQFGVAELADHRVRRERCLGGADHHRVGAVHDGPGGVRDRVQSAGLVAGHHPARALVAAADRHLAGAGRVEPGDGLIGADELRSLAPQLLELALAELAAAGAGRGHHADRVGVFGIGDESGVRHRLVGGGHRVVREPVGLHQVAAVDDGLRVEVPHLARDAQREVRTALAGYPVEDAHALPGGLPEGIGSDAVRCHHTQAGDHRPAFLLT